jgi:hypothetical protein
MRFRCLLLPLVVSVGVHAQPSRAPTSESRAELKKQLDGSSDQVAAAAKRIRELPPRERAEFATALQRVLERGVRDDVAPVVLRLTAETLGELARTTLVLYLHHRSASVRLAAVQAVALLRSREATEELSSLAKREQEASVRKVVLESLAQVGNAEAERTLRDAWSHGDTDALVLLGGSCVNCKEVVQSVGTVSFEALAKVARAAFARKGEAAASLQLELIRAIAAVQSRETRELLVALRTEFAGSLSKAVQRALEEKR